jgi:hypothetical protein
MKKHVMAYAVIVAVVGVCSVHSQAPRQERDELPGPMPPAKGPKDASTQDPTKLPRAFEGLMKKEEDRPLVVTLVAKVVSKNRPAMAIIEVSGKEFLVARDSVIVGEKAAIHVLEVNADEIRLEMQPASASNKIIILK